MTQDAQRRRVFLPLVLLVQVLSVTMVALMVVWLAYYRGGFKWSPDEDHLSQLFNYHPLFMTLGMLFVFGDAVLVYRIFHNERKPIIKLVHGSMMAVGVLFAIVGLVAVFKFHNMAGIPNMYSLHSWLGISTVVCFCMQLVLGFVSFLAPKLSMNFRTAYLPIHICAGVAMLGLSLACALTGITEKAIFHKDEIGYTKKSGEAILINMMGMIFVIFICLVGYIVTNPDFKRQPSPEEMNLQLTENEHE